MDYSVDNWNDDYKYNNLYVLQKAAISSAEKQICCQDVSIRSENLPTISNLEHCNGLKLDPIVCLNDDNSKKKQWRKKRKVIFAFLSSFWFVF